MKTLKHLFDRNIEWADGIKKENPDFFTQLSTQQSPEYLWIGCSDSRVPANQIINLLPGEVFVHRNIANVVAHTDFNCLSVVQFAVEILKVKHIVVCGHYGCGGIKASLDQKNHGVLNNWLRHIQDVSRFHQEELSLLNDEQKENRLCELNVIEQVKNVGNSAVIQQAWKQGAELSLHGWIYSIKNGMLKDLDMCIESDEELQKKC